jgi:hypothetical protein
LGLVVASGAAGVVVASGAIVVASGAAGAVVESGAVVVESGAAVVVTESSCAVALATSEHALSFPDASTAVTETL